jgi:formylglycine-generating enzyme required for sulfatase activity
MARYEVDYSDWVRFLSHWRDEDTSVFRSYLPDSNARNKEIFYNKIYPEQFGEKTKFVTVISSDYDFPVTGISKQQAEAYCNYLNEKESIQTQKVNGKKVSYRFEYRLPTPEEFTKANEKGMVTESQLLVRNTGRNKEGCFLINFDTKPQCKNDSLGFTQMSHRLLRKWAFNPNLIGLYNTQGNVAEMTAENNKAIGGSYIHPINECQINSINNYTKPEMWLGFRVMADIVYENTDPK